MRVPWSLRWALAWAAIRHEFITISVDSDTYHGTHYRFDVQPQAVKRWLRRNESRREALRQARKEERERIVRQLRVIHTGAILDPDGAIEALGAYIAELSPTEEEQ